MTASRIAVSTEAGVTTVRLGADGHIFLTAALCEELEGALTTAANDDAVRTVIVTGANEGVFMRHYSVAEILALGAQLGEMSLKPGDAMPYRKAPIDRCIDLVETMPKPVIAAINGEAMGGAMELSLGCDLRIARRGPYRLGQPETVLGILPGAGGTQRLARVVGPAHAMELALSGIPVPPEEAFRIGLVHAVVDDPVADARARARHFATIPPAALAHTKRLVRESRSLPLDKGLELERTLFMDLCLRPEGRKLMAAYEAGEFRFAFEGGRWTVTAPPFA